MRPGDAASFYHTGDEKAVVGALESPGPMPIRRSATRSGVVVDIEAVRRSAGPMPLAASRPTGRSPTSPWCGYPGSRSCR